MVVDDNHRTLNAIGGMIRRHGFETVEYLRSEDCLAALSIEKISPIAALIDVILDGGRLGTEIVGALRASTQRHTPVILMSGWTLDAAPFRLPLGEQNVVWMQKPLDVKIVDPFLANAAASWALPLGSPLVGIVGEMVRRFSLNSQEARIVGQIASGSTRFELATHLALSNNTVKWQVKGLLAKTRLESVDQVAALLLRLLSGSATLPDEKVSRPLGAPERAVALGAQGSNDSTT